MIRVAFWRKDDIVVSPLNPRDTYQIVKAVVKRDRVWIELLHVHTKEIVKGWESTLQEKGFVGYRTSHLVEVLR